MVSTAHSLGCKTLLQTTMLIFIFTCQPLFLVLGLFFPGELVEGAGWSLGGQGRELLRLQLLLDAVILTAAGRHCGGGWLAVSQGRSRNSSPSLWVGLHGPYCTY